MKNSIYNFPASQVQVEYNDTEKKSGMLACSSGFLTFKPGALDSAESFSDFRFSSRQVCGW